MKSLDAAEVLAAKPAERKKMIESQLPLNYVPDGDTNEERELSRARDYSDIINSFIEGYIRLKIDLDRNSGNSLLISENMGQRMFSEMENWKETKGIESIKSVKSNVNLFTASGADTLANANKATRSLNTKMGLLWEKIAQLSPHAINPENEFDLKIKGIDIICLNYSTGDLEYIQLKTQKNTLTGSQKGRSERELSIHDNPVFCTAFPFSTWTFRSDYVPQFSGADFWGRIGMDYQLVRETAFEMIRGLDSMYIEFTTDQGRTDEI